MLKIISFLVVMVFVQPAFAERLTDEKKRVIDEMLELTGALKIGEMMGTTVANQMVAMLSQQQRDVDPKVVAIIQDEIGNIMHDEFVANGFINEMSYEIYHKYFSLAELKETLAFYKTPTGSKMASLLPQVTQEGMIAGQKHGESLGPIIQQRLMARFQKEGIR